MCDVVRGPSPPIETYLGQIVYLIGIRHRLDLLMSHRSIDSTRIESHACMYELTASLHELTVTCQELTATCTCTGRDGAERSPS